MTDSVHEAFLHHYDSVRISLASSADIRSWSFGEVSKPETINYRTNRPEQNGLFCESIFGPEKDYECGCGKYQGTKYKGIVCDRCGVKLTHSRVRRERMGHINLAAPIVHIWFFKAMPSRLGSLLAMKTSDLEKIVYFDAHVVTEPGRTELDRGRILTEREYLRAVERFGAASFTAMTGAEAIRELLQRLDLERLSKEIREELGRTKSKQQQKALSKRLKIVEQIRGSRNDPKWMVLDVIPVIPPDLRPIVLLESGNFATSDLNDLYRRIINRNNRLKKLIDLAAPEEVLLNERRMLQQAVDALFDNGRCRRPVLGSSNRPLKSITDMLKGKQGRFRENLLGKRVDYSARSVIVVGPELRIWQCGLPKKIALELYQPFLIRKLKEHGLADTIKSAKRMLARRDPEVWDILAQVIQNHPVLLLRQPTLHRSNVQAFEPVLIEGNAIRIHPLVCRGFNADFDGDQMAVHLPLSVEAQTESHVLMMSTHNIFSPANGAPIVCPTQEIILGLHFLTCRGTASARTRIPRFKDSAEAMLALDLPRCDPRRVALHDPIEVHLERFSQFIDERRDPAEPMPPNRRIETTVGRLLFSEILPDGTPFYNLPVDADRFRELLTDVEARLGRRSTIELLERATELGRVHATLSGISISITDLPAPERMAELARGYEQRRAAIDAAYRSGAIDARERRRQLGQAWMVASGRSNELIRESMREDASENGAERPSFGRRTTPHPLELMIESGARANHGMLAGLSGLGGLFSADAGKSPSSALTANLREGLGPGLYFRRAQATRAGIAAPQVIGPIAGDLTRRLCHALSPITIVEHDCCTSSGLRKPETAGEASLDGSLRRIALYRTSASTISNPITDQILVERNQIITRRAAAMLEDLGLSSIDIRSPVTCRTAGGICARCYGHDLSTNRIVEVGTAVGVIAAQSLSQPFSQAAFDLRRTGDAARGLRRLRRVIELLEARRPRSAAVFAPCTGVLRVRRSSATDRVTLAVTDSRGRMHHLGGATTDSLRFEDGSPVLAGMQLTNGSIDANDRLRMDGQEAFVNSTLAELRDLLHQIPAVVDDRHLEVLLRGMLSMVRVLDPRGTEFRPDQLIDRRRFEEANSTADLRRPATCVDNCTGITALIQSAEGFLSRACFQRTRDALTDAAWSTSPDMLRSSRECLQLGRRVSVGSGLPALLRSSVRKHDAEPETPTTPD